MTYRNTNLLRAVASLPCMHCGQHGSTQASHSNQLRDGKGKGLKASDAAIAALCASCHRMIDQGRALSRAERVALWEDAHRATMRQLFERGLVNVTRWL
ncbi:MAG: hypothetical protein KGI52_08830 [Burkholderiales bacterium]|nr:hypothetical protein [Burkholderiales bacterium]